MSFHLTIQIIYKGGNMPNIFKTILGVFVLILFFIGCEENTVNPDVNDNDNLRLEKVTESATGSGHFVVGEDLRVFTHNAKNKPNGSVNGHFNLNIQGIDFHIGGSVICLNVDGNTAYFAGVIETSNQEGPFWLPGDFVIWSTIDNGEGNNSDADRITKVQTGWSEAQVLDFCQNGFNHLEYFDIEQGNIQIH